jgi:hypothetical protein
VNIPPKKLKDGDNDALTTPLSVTGAAEVENYFRIGGESSAIAG